VTGDNGGGQVPELSILAQRAGSLGLTLDENQLAAFERYRLELLQWNKRVNLTAIREPAEVELRHFVDSLTCYSPLADLIAASPAACIVDVGSGAGFPGLPLKLGLPTIRLTLVESIGKKSAFLQHIVRVLGLDAVTVVTARAEDVARDPGFRERYDGAVSRAVASLPVLLELCLPFLRVGGRLVAPRRGDLAAQQAEAARAADVLGGRFCPSMDVDLGPSLRDYGLVIVDKREPTPARYPRRPGQPAKQPLI
jgi:16S rRNA (guanine527-N7)-methyltransferase